MNLRQTRTLRVFFVFTFVWALLLALPAGEARSDPLIVVRAMTATTIAQAYLDRDSLTLELEIGVGDVLAFRNLMPDEIYDRLGQSPEAWGGRLRRFMREDLRVSFDGRGATGELRELSARPRVERDEVTGEPLPVQPEDGELTVFVRLVYDVPDRPATIALSPPTDPNDVPANIGFVLYHRGIPVNDFRYLSRTETARLDWSDPWYSRFDNRNLWRQFEAPANAYLYVEPFEVRKEIVIRPINLSPWLDLGLEGKETITVEEQASIKQRVAEFLAERSPVTIDGQPVEARLDRINFIYRTLRTSGVIDPPRELDVHAALLGVIYYFPVDGLPDEVTLEWDLFDDRIAYVPGAATDEAGGLPSVLRTDDATLRWRNFLTNPTMPGAVEVPASSGSGLRWVAFGISVLALAGLVIVGRRHLGETLRGGRPAARPLLGALALVAVLVVAAPVAIRSASVSDETAGEILGQLLENTYGAFDYREEDRIYDTLARSVAGDLLTDVYLETRRSLELENQGGARAKVQAVEVLDATSRPLGGARGFEVTGTWNVAGSIGHWGHVHQRINQYEARLVIREIDGLWRIAELELLQEVRL